METCILVHPPLLEATVGTSVELPQDILMCIFGTLEIPDLIRAGSVCTSWNLAYTSLRSHGHYNRPQTPCLLYTCESSDKRSACLYSLVEKRVFKITLPEPPICTRTLIGSSQGLLVTVDRSSEMQLLNPITGQQIDLPSVITIEHVKPIYDKDSGAIHQYEYSCHSGTRVYCPPSIVALEELRHELHHKVLVFSDTTCHGYVVVLIHSPYCQLSFARVGRDDSWTWLPPHNFYHDCIYRDGMLYAVTSKGEIHGFDLNSSVVTMNIIIGRKTNRCLTHDLEPRPGDFVFWNTGKIKVYEVDDRGKELKRANHAYFTDDNALWTNGLLNNRRDMGILNLDNNTREEIVSPQLWSNCPAPMWITPNLRKMNLL
ncbi:hypothetical protein BRADI_5g03430v3 [Brachypodium distachyon]|uniref:Uncharacterized protein n=1 Tax=Brachypodium distachyon TaxID=15368 RepID=A0A0Q3E2A2_BRADI|nr:hypothetical protein BRADI_5g03430v3 [Brachypodium distachyon]